MAKEVGPPVKLCEGIYRRLLEDPASKCKGLRAELLAGLPVRVWPWQLPSGTLFKLGLKVSRHSMLVVDPSGAMRVVPADDAELASYTGVWLEESGL